jgi:excisionase family DNA binding protein
MHGKPADNQPRDALVELEAPLLRTSDIAEMLNVSERTVTNWARSGRIRCVRMPGGQWRFPRSSVRDYLAATKEEAR